MRLCLVGAVLIIVLACKCHAQPEEAPCTDIPPPGSYTCREQREFDKCDARWMVASGLCNATCGRCIPVPPTNSEPAFVEEPVPVPPQPKVAAPQAIAPAAEQFRTDLIAAAGELTTSPEDLEVPPETISTTMLPSAAADPVPPAPVAPVMPPPPTMITAAMPPAPAPEVLSCNSTGQPTAYDYLMNNTDLATLREAVDVLDLARVMQRSDVQFTLFAPTNRAFEIAASGQGQTVNTLLGARNILRDIILTHFVPNAVLNSAQLANMTAIQPQSGGQVFLTSQDGTLSLVSVGSTALVTDPDAAVACTYAIHVIDTVLLPSPSLRTGLNPQYQAAVARGSLRP